MANPTPPQDRVKSPPHTTVGQTTVDLEPKCSNPKCRRTLAGYMGRPWSIKCQRCNATNNKPE